jgi:hypothetical protein
MQGRANRAELQRRMMVGATITAVENNQIDDVSPDIGN